MVVFVYTYMQMCFCVYLRVDGRVYICIHMYAYMYAYVYAYVYEFICVMIRVHVHYRTSYERMYVVGIHNRYVRTHVVRILLYLILTHVKM